MTDQSPNQHQGNHSRRKKIMLAATVIFLAIGFAFLLYWLFVGQFYESTDDAYVGGNAVQVMSDIPGRISAIFADETDSVSQGEKLITLDQADADINLQRAQARLALTARQVSQYYKNVGQLQANIQIQEDNLKKADEDFTRRQGLIVNKTISEEELRHAKIAKDSADDALRYAKQQLSSSMALVGNTDLYHHPQIQQAAVNLRNAYLNWLRTVIYAPVTGYLGKRPAQVGQQVNTNTVLMVIIPSHQLWVDANFKESQLKHIRIGQPVELTSDRYGSDVTYKGTVAGISPGTGSAFDLLPPQNATGNWIKIIQRVPIRILIDPKQLEENPLQIGLSMTVTVNTHNRKKGTLTHIPSNKMLYQSYNYYSELKKADQLIDEILRKNASNLSIPSLKQ